MFLCFLFASHQLPYGWLKQDLAEVFVQSTEFFQKNMYAQPSGVPPKSTNPFANLSFTNIGNVLLQQNQAAAEQAKQFTGAMGKDLQECFAGAQRLLEHSFGIGAINISELSSEADDDKSEWETTSESSEESASQKHSKIVDGLIAVADLATPYLSKSGNALIRASAHIYKASRGTCKLQKSFDHAPKLAKRQNSSRASKQSKNLHKTQSTVWKNAKPYKKGIKTNGLSGKNREYYQWDYTHNDIEVYDYNLKHKGSMDPISGKIYKMAKARNIKF